MANGLPTGTVQKDRVDPQTLCQLLENVKKNQEQPVDYLQEDIQ